MATARNHREWTVRGAFALGGGAAAAAVFVGWGVPMLGGLATCAAPVGFGVALAVGFAVAWIVVRPRLEGDADARGVVGLGLIAVSPAVAMAAYFVGIYLTAGGRDGWLAFEGPVTLGALFAAGLMAAGAWIATRRCVVRATAFLLAWALLWPWTWLAFEPLGMANPVLLCMPPGLALWMLPLGAVAGDWIAVAERHPVRLGALR